MKNVLFLHALPLLKLIILISLLENRSIMRVIFAAQVIQHGLVLSLKQRDCFLVPCHMKSTKLNKEYKA